MPSPEWPLILCGPMLRRVEEQAVTVWVALRESRYVTLRVYVLGDGFTGYGMTNWRPLTVLEGSAATRKFGAKLHIACVTAAAPGSHPTELKLREGRMYCYDLELRTAATDAPDPFSNNLWTNGLLEPFETTPLNYEDGLLPAFAYCPSNLAKLRLFHGSCRKPHAPGRDALSILDDVMQEAFDGPETHRPYAHPHQLFLTGDQIYVDDVAGALLAALTPLGHELLGWTETLPGISANEPALAPTKRLTLVKNTLLYTSDYAASHLLFLGEFYAMYLLAWSPALWPEFLPTDEDVFGADAVQQHDAAAEAFQQSWQSAFGEAEYDDEGKAIETFREQFTRLETFRLDVGAARRVLAQVPTYMMFDDHEVTDDWFLNTDFARGVLDPANTAARRTLTNSLLAFSIFQAWGNNPAEFAAGRGKALLDAAEAWDGTDTAKIDEISEYVGLQDWGTTASPGRVVFDFLVDAPAHSAIVLDTRTWREFAASGPPQLISASAMQRQVADRLPRPAPARDVVFVVSPAPVLGFKVLEDIVQPLAASFKGPFVADTEAWKLNMRAFQRLLRQLGEVPRVVLLSGDVHYAFTIGCEFWDDAAGQAAHIAQLTSSALRNEDPHFPANTHLLHKIGWTPLSTKPEVFLGWENPAHDLKLRWDTTDLALAALILKLLLRGASPILPIVPAEVRVTSVSEPTVVPNSSRLAASRAPDWLYRLTFIRESRTARPRTYQPSKTTQPPSSTDRESALGTYKTVLQEHEKLLSRGHAGHEIVGLNNIGEITFAANPIRVFHRLWWRLPDQPAAPLTQHVIDLQTFGQKPTVTIGI